MASEMRWMVDRTGAVDYRSYVHAVRRAGSTPNGVFAARVMWGSMPRIVGKLDTGVGARGDLDLLADASGELRLVHIKRGDIRALTADLRSDRG
jgi:LPS sulfotransferase NodH